MTYEKRTVTGGFMMRGGIEVPSDVDELPDANYWSMGAKWAKAEIFKLTPAEWTTHVENVLDGIWNKNLSWREICLQTEILLDCLKANCGLIFVGKPTITVTPEVEPWNVIPDATTQNEAMHEMDAWQVEAEAQAADAADLFQTQEDARF